MKEVYTSPNYTITQVVKSLLESNSIVCEIKNEILGSTVSELTADQAWLSIHVKESDFDRAEILIKEQISTSDSIPSFCPKCDSEEIELDRTDGIVSFAKYKCKKCNHRWGKRRL